MAIKRPPTKEELDRLYFLYKKASDRYFMRLKDCQHEFEKVFGFKDDEISSFMRCKICGHHAGWWCPKSEDHICHYNYKTHGEGCIYCHLPEERK
jgi:hypothetical protein